MRNYGRQISDYTKIHCFAECVAKLVNNVYNSLRQMNIYDKKILNLNSDFFYEKSNRFSATKS